MKSHNADYEIAAASPLGLEIGGVFPITHVDHRAVGEITFDPTSDDRVLCGYACIWDKPLYHENRFMVFKKGAFKTHLSSQPNVGFWLDHDETRVVASTANGELELMQDSKGLAFRLRIPDTALGRQTRQLAKDHTYTGMSVGCRFSRKNIQRIAGEDVTVIDDALLTEISFVRTGAVTDAFASLLECDEPLREYCASPRMDSEHKWALFMRAFHSLAHKQHRD